MWSCSAVWFPSKEDLVLSFSFHKNPMQLFTVTHSLIKMDNHNGFFSPNRMISVWNNITQNNTSKSLESKVKIIRYRAKTWHSLSHSEVEWRQTCAGHPARIRPLYEPGGGWLLGDGPWRSTEQHRHGGQYLGTHHSLVFRVRKFKDQNCESLPIYYIVHYSYLPLWCTLCLILCKLPLLNKNKTYND